MAPLTLSTRSRPQPVLAHVELRPHAALAADAAAERDRRQLAVEPIAPLVIDADVLAGIARLLAPHQRAAMGAAVDEGLDLAVLVAVDDDRRVADPGGAEITGIGDLGLERQVTPRLPAKDPLLLAGVDVGIMIEPVRHPAVVQRRPDRSVNPVHVGPTSSCRVALTFRPNRGVMQWRLAFSRVVRHGGAAEAMPFGREDRLPQSV